MLQIDDKDIKKLENDLKVFAHKAFPFATKNTLNQSAFKAMNIAKQNVRNQMITRNKFTEQSIRVEQTKTLNTAKQAAYVGSIAEYMEDQEFGGTTSKKGKNKTVLPTSFSAGQDGQIPRTKLPTNVNKLKNIALRRKILHGNFKSKRQKFFIHALLAANEGQKNIYIPGKQNGTGGIYRVWGRLKKKGRFTRVKMKMLYSFRRNPSRIPKNSWLKPSIEETTKYMPEIYKQSLEYQIKRNGLFNKH